MCLADFLKFYTLGSLFIIMIFFFVFFGLKIVIKIIQLI